MLSFSETAPAGDAGHASAHISPADGASSKSIERREQSYRQQLQLQDIENKNREMFHLHKNGSQKHLRMRSARNKTFAMADETLILDLLSVVHLPIVSPALRLTVPERHVHQPKHVFSADKQIAISSQLFMASHVTHSAKMYPSSNTNFESKSFRVKPLASPNTRRETPMF